MSNNSGADVYNGIRPVNNTLSGDSMAYAFRLPTEILKLPSASTKKKEVVRMVGKNRKINAIYMQIIVLFFLFALFSAYNLVTGEWMDRLGSSLLLILAVSGFVAFYDDRNRWRKNCGG